MRSGERIQHPELGDGTVEFVISRGGKAGAQVDFGYMSAWISREELGFREQHDRLPGPISSPSETAATEIHLPTLSNDVVEARRAILALKLGQVLEENVLDLSIGTDDIRTSLERAVGGVARRRPAIILFKGSWGSGKTHLLTMLNKLAADGDLATASVILDGEGVRFSEPMGLMETLLGSLRYPGEAVPRGISEPVVSLRRKFTYKYEVERRLGWRIANAIFQVPMRCLDEPDTIDVLEDYFRMTLPATHANAKLRRLGNRGIALPPLKAWRVAERPNRFCNLLKGWAEFCALTGAKGLAVAFDEVDVEYASTISNGHRRWLRRNLLKAFRTILKKNVPLLLAFGSAPASDVDDENDAVIDLVRSVGRMDLEIEVPQPDLEQTRELGQRIIGLYAKAYPDRMSNVDVQKLKLLIDRFAEHHQRGLNPAPRNFVRGALERLDVAPGVESYIKIG